MQVVQHVFQFFLGSKLQTPTPTQKTAARGVSLTLVTRAMPRCFLQAAFDGEVRAAIQTRLDEAQKGTAPTGAAKVGTFPMFNSKGGHFPYVSPIESEW